MYLWKYWRESRITFAVGMALVGLMLWAVLKALGHVQPEGNSAQIYMVMDGLLMLPLGFLGLRYGSFGVGRDLGEGCGSFVFSRPRSRAFFVWSDWSFGMAQLLSIVIAANSVLLLTLHRIAPGSGHVLVFGVPVTLFSVFCLHCTAGLLFAGLLFGLTYFSSVLLKNRGLLLSLGILLAYLIAKSVAKHYWPESTCPTLP